MAEEQALVLEPAAAAADTERVALPFTDSRSAKRMLKKPSKWRAVVWQYFGFECGHEGKVVDDKHVRCTLCDAKVGYSGNTSNLQNHLANRHREFSTASSKSSGPPAAQGQIKIGKTGFLPIGKVQKLLPNSQRATSITAAVANFIAEDLRPTSTIEGSGFRKMMAVLEPRYHEPCHKTISKVLSHQRDDLVESIKSDLENVPSVSVTTDLWTSHAGDNYCVLTVHYITGEWMMDSSVLACHKLVGDRTAEFLAAFLQEQAAEWVIEDKIAGITTDNAANMVNAASEHFQWAHTPCAGHTLQLCAKPALEICAVEDVISRVKKVVTFFHRSYKAKEELATKQQQLGLKNHSLIQAVDTRRNSSFQMLQRFNDQAIAISAVLMGSSKQKHRDMAITATEQKITEDLCSILQPVTDATTILSAHKYPSLSYMQPIINGLLKYFAALPSDSIVIHDIKTVIRRQLQVRFSCQAGLKSRLLASIVDPRFKTLAGCTGEEVAVAKDAFSTEVVGILQQNQDAATVSNTTADVAHPKLARSALVDSS